MYYQTVQRQQQELASEQVSLDPYGLHTEQSPHKLEIRIRPVQTGPGVSSSNVSNKTPAFESQELKQALNHAETTARLVTPPEMAETRENPLALSPKAAAAESTFQVPSQPEVQVSVKDRQPSPARTIADVSVLSKDTNTARITYQGDSHLADEPDMLDARLNKLDGGDSKSNQDRGSDGLRTKITAPVDPTVAPAEARRGSEMQAAARLEARRQVSHTTQG